MQKNKYENILHKLYSKAEIVYPKPSWGWKRSILSTL